MSVTPAPPHLQREIIGESPQIQAVINRAKRIARNSAITTLIIGESGTGKEVVARLIHKLGNTSKRPFVDINCGAIPETLLESELFGHEKGAFTGANTRKQGLFELASGGTIFLDEIGNTSLNFQMKLLKVVENKRFRRVNGLEEITVSTRIIAATNVDLREAVRAGQFREDLYFRLNVYEIRLPPLRQRGHDVLLLAEHFIDFFNRQYQRQVRGLTDSAKRLLMSYRWPGNIRELRNAIERAVLVECDDWIEPQHLMLDTEPPAVTREPEPAREVKTVAIPLDWTELAFPEDGLSLEEVERHLILAALDKANGNISKAARLLRINRGKLRYRLERLGLTPDDVSHIKRKKLTEFLG